MKLRLPDGRNLEYEQYGDPRGRPLFIFHGWPSSRLQGERFDQIAKKEGIRIISPDRPGYGLSDFKKDRTLLDWPDDVTALADHLNIKKFAVMGVSGGGPYAAVCAYKIPQRLTKVGIVVGLSPTNIAGVLQGMAWPNRLTWRMYHLFPPFIALTSSVVFLYTKRKLISEKMVFQYAAKADKKLLESQTLQQELARNRREAFHQGKRGPAADLEIYTHDWGFRLGDIRANVFLWYGEDDKNVSIEMGKYYASRIPKSKLTIYPGEGHMISVTHAAEILRTLAG